MPRAKKLHDWTGRGERNMAKVRCDCGMRRWTVISARSGQPIERCPVLFLYGRDGIHWSTARPECAPTEVKR